MHVFSEPQIRIRVHPVVDSGILKGSLTHPAMSRREDVIPSSSLSHVSDAIRSEERQGSLHARASRLIAALKESQISGEAHC